MPSASHSDCASEPSSRGDPDALDHVLDRPRADRGVGVGDRPELVVRVLEEVRVHRADPQAARLDVRAQRAVVVDRVPREVHRHRARRAGQAVDLGGVVDALEDVARAAGLREDAEARARSRRSPTTASRSRARASRLCDGWVGHGVSSGWLMRWSVAEAGDVEEAAVGRLGGVAVGAGSSTVVGGRGGDRPQVGQRAELAGGARLHEHVAERGRLDGPGEHLAAA